MVKLSRVIAELERQMEHVLVHSGQNYDFELSDIFITELGITPPKHFLGAVGATVAETIGLVISRFDGVLESERPDAVLLYGDTNTCLGVIAAKRRKIPVFHMEAGNRCFDQRVPEELNRKVVDHLSDVNMTNSEHARRYLLSEGLRPEMVIKTGSPMNEVLRHYRPLIDASDVIDRLNLEVGNYVLVSAHREETVDVAGNLTRLVECLAGIAEHTGMQVIVSTHPRTKDRIERAGSRLEPRLRGRRIEFLKPFGFPDYVRLEEGAYCVASDSGTLTEESSILGFPALMLRETHERPEGMDYGTLVFTGLNCDRVLEGLELVVSQARTSASRLIEDYDVDDVSRIVSRVILSYVDYVNRTTWHKSGRS